MVGYFENKSYQPKQYLFASAISSVATRIISHPLDVLKIRFQLQVEPISKTCQQSKYTDISQALRLILKEEGSNGFWKSQPAGLHLSVFYGIFHFGIYERTTKLAYHFLGLKPSHSLSFVSGSIAGGVATAISYPFDFFRTRLIAQGNTRVYKGFLHAMNVVQRKEGLRFLYKGLTPALIYAIPQAGLQFGFYSVFTSLCGHNNSQNSHIDIEKSLACGAVAGALSKSIVFPLDLVKKRMQIQNFQFARAIFGEFPNALNWKQCFARTLEKETVKGLYKGFLPSILKASLVSGLGFSIYEEACYKLSQS